MFNSLYSHHLSCILLDPDQPFFHPGDSTINRLLSLTRTVFEAFVCNPIVDVCSVYLHFSKAFDRVWHIGLTYKLKWCGISGQFPFLVQSFLCDQKKRSRRRSMTSRWKKSFLFQSFYVTIHTSTVDCKVWEAAFWPRLYDATIFGYLVRFRALICSFKGCKWKLFPGHCVKYCLKS